MTFEEQFAEFWAAYPNKKGKADAMKAFKTAIKATTLEKMLDAIKLYRAHKPEWMGFKHPATWLRAGCWDDEWEVKAPTFTFAGPRPSEAYHETRQQLTPEEQARRAAMVKRMREEGIIGRTMQ